MLLHALLCDVVVVFIWLFWSFHTVSVSDRVELLSLGTRADKDGRCWKWNTIGDKIILRGLKFHGFHRVKPEEKKLGQKFLVDVDAWMDLWKVGKSDNLFENSIYR
ncbi:hypothetical protein J1N35_018520 [Gossypium stocksii]|uniref:dihydroneopterin aldolase n=1 Tax=Gossypium stocksii TaxID=47602 RepID=A0A9D3VRC9_9ROSI|nr:hypothetical protein J1N35_018520 [Gossypium stocksii]